MCIQSISYTKVIRGDTVSFYETFESSFCRYKVHLVSRARSLPSRGGNEA